MGLSAFAALIAIALAFIAQTPRLISRLGLSGARLDLRARNLTGYGLALLLLALGFFLAGVPLGESEATVAGEAPVETTVPEEEAVEVAVAGTIVPEETAILDETSAVDESLPSTGAMGGLGAEEQPGGGSQSGAFFPTRPAIESGDTLTATNGMSPTVPLELQETSVAEGVSEPVEPAAEPTATPAATATATPFPTATPTPTPEPTLTPTPIFEPTARVGDNTSTLVVRRTPGGDQLWLLYRGDIVIPLAGRAFHSGGLWREISTVDGVVGWVQDVFLDYGEEEADSG